MKSLLKGAKTNNDLVFQIKGVFLYLSLEADNFDTSTSRPTIAMRPKTYLLIFHFFLLAKYEDNLNTSTVVTP